MSNAPASRKTDILMEHLDSIASLHRRMQDDVNELAVLKAELARQLQSERNSMVEARSMTFPTATSWVPVESKTNMQLEDISAASIGSASRGIGRLVEPCPSSPTQRGVEPTSPTRSQVTERSGHQLSLTRGPGFIGRWQADDGFYDNGVIEITRKGWRPVNPHAAVWRNSRYTRRVLGPDRWRLIETREDGEQRHFIMQFQAESQKLVVTIPDTSVSWELRRWVPPSKASSKNSTFTDMVVDWASTLPEHEDVWGKMIKMAETSVKTPTFEFVTGLVIFVNCIILGWDAQRQLQGEGSHRIFELLEYIFVSWYVIEIILRLMAVRQVFFYATYNVFDTVLVILSVAFVFFIRSSDYAPATTVQMLRVCRLLRFIRLSRLLGWFVGLDKLANLFARSVYLGTSMLLMVLTFVYVFTVVAAELVLINAEDDRSDLLYSEFSSLPKIALKITRFLTLDNAAELYEPLVMRGAASVGLYFFCLLVGSVLMMNLVSALLIESALKQAKMDDERNGTKMRQRLRILTDKASTAFDILDKDKDGALRIQEVLNAEWGNVPDMEELSSLFRAEVFIDLFEYFDVDGNNELTREEFVNGVKNLCLKTTSFENVEILSRLMRHQQCLQDIRYKLDNLDQRIYNLQPEPK